jgi:hypothetical protein
MASSTDVRQWLIEQGETPPARGPVTAAQRALYDEAHPDPAGADFVTGADLPDDPAAAPIGTHAGERAPRPRAGRPRGAAALTSRLWGPAKGQGKGPRARKPAPKHARASVAGFVEDFWGDLAWMAAPLPPLQRVLQVQAPFAGVILEDTVRGTVIDNMVQPVARNVQAVKAINGTLGPPAYVLGIMLTGKRVPIPVIGPDGPVLDPETGEQVFNVDFDARTKMMFMGLRYSLLHMGSLSEQQMKAITARADDRIARGREVDKMIAWIFGMPEPPGDSAEEEALQHARTMARPSAAAAPGPAGPDVTYPPPDMSTHPYAYPPAPAAAMDAEGADPAR